MLAVSISVSEIAVIEDGTSWRFFYLVQINCKILPGFHLSLYQRGSPVAVLQRYGIDIDIDINDKSCIAMLADFRATS